MATAEARLVALFILAVAIAFGAAALTMPMGTVLAPGPGLVPLILAGATAVAAGAAAMSPGKLRASDEQSTSPSLKPLAICCILGAMILAFERVGYVATIAAGAFILFKFVERRSLVLSVLVAGVLSGGSYLLFTKLLRVSLP